MKQFIFFIIACLVFFTVTLPVSAQSASAVDDKIRQLEEKIGQLKSQGASLSKEIGILNNSIELTNLQIAAKKGTIAKLELEIQDINRSIDETEKNLRYQISKYQLLLPYTYKSQVTPQLGILFFTGDIESAVYKAQFFSWMQKQSSNLLILLKKTQNGFIDQKNLREAKKSQQEDLKNQLVADYIKLDSQKKQKQQLLEVTKNDEKNYQVLLAQAKAQAAAFRRYVSVTGSTSILSNQTFCDSWGCYYNQRDSQWALMPLGRSELSVMEYGCLVSSVAMVLTHYGKSIKPSDIAAEQTAFFSPDSRTALLYYSFNVNGLSVVANWIGTSTENIDNALSSGNPVIVGVYAGPAHFIVLKSGIKGDYIMNDPMVEGGHDILFSSKYKPWDITDARTLTIR